MANLDKLENGNFKLGIDIVADGSVKKTLKTADTYVDRNIEVEVNVADASYEVKADNTVTATVTADDTTYLTDTDTGFGFTVKADASATKATVGVKDAGFADAADTIDVTAKTAETDVKTKYIKAGALATPEALEMAVTGGNGVEVTELASEPETGFFIKTTAAGNVEVGTAGWIAEGVNKDVAGTAYYSIPTANLANAGTQDAIYTDVSETAPVLISGDFLYINEGYIENSKISLAKLVPDASNVTGHNDLVYKTVSVYDNDGNLVAGTMGDAELSAIVANDATANISAVNVAAKDDKSAFEVTASGSINGTASVSISKTGYATTDLSKDGVVSGTVTLDATLPVAALKAEVTGDGAVKPVIKDAGSNAKNSGVSATAPTGQKYIAVDAAEILKTATVTPQIATEGYGTADLHTATAASVTAGAEAADKVYIGIENGGHTVSHTQDVTQEAIAIATSAVVSDADYSITGVGSVEPTGVPYITISTSNTSTPGSVTSQASCTTVEGYVLAGTDSDTAKTTAIGAQVTQAQNKYIKIYTGIVVD